MLVECTVINALSFFCCCWLDRIPSKVLKNVMKNCGYAGWYSDVFPYLNLAQWSLPTCEQVVVCLQLLEPFRGHQAGVCRPQPSTTPAVLLSGAFRPLRMFILGRFLSACRNCSLESWIICTSSCWSLHWASPQIWVPAALALCVGVIAVRRDRVMFGDTAHSAGTGAACVSDAAAAIQARFCWRRQSPAPLCWGCPSSEGMCAALFSNCSARAGFTSGFSAHLLSTVVAGISRRDFSNPHFSNWIACGNVCKSVKMFTIYTWLQREQLCAHVALCLFQQDSTTSVRLMTWFHKTFSSKLHCLQPWAGVKQITCAFIGCLVLFTV